MIRNIGVAVAGAMVGLFNIVSAQTPSRHQLFSDLLSSYVQNGVVDYSNLRQDERLPRYTQWLALTNPDTLPDENEQLAFWINAYNAYTLKIICDNFPVESINDLNSGGLIIAHIFKTTVWDKDLAVVGGKTMSLNTIEHEIIRAQFGEPRAHFALVCGSKSCPGLRNEAYEGPTLDRQLDDQGRAFFSDTLKNTFDPEHKTAALSKILDWYESDFGSSDAEVLQYVARFLPDSLSEEILADPGNWDVGYTAYDWSLNGL